MGDLPDPQPASGEVRVRLQWSGVNPSDVKARSGARGPVMPFPQVIPHSDGMGVIDAVGADVDPARLSQRVWVWNAGWGRPNGTTTGLVVLPQQQAVVLPDNVPGEVGACLGIPALTAAHAVLTDGGVAGQSVLVAGGAGAVGHYSVQFARLLGALQVITTVSSSAKAELARAAGADVVIDYKSENVVERVREVTAGAGVDRVIEVDIAANADRHGGGSPRRDVGGLRQRHAAIQPAVFPDDFEQHPGPVLHRLPPERFRPSTCERGPR